MVCGSFVFLCLVFLMLSRLFIAAFWSPTGKGLTFWLLLALFIVFLLLSHGYPGSGVVFDCIVPDLCLLSYLHNAPFGIPTKIIPFKIGHFQFPHKIIWSVASVFFFFFFFLLYI